MNHIPQDYKNHKKLFFLNIKPISRILGTTSGFKFPILKSIHNCNLEWYASLGLNVIRAFQSFKTRITYYLLCTLLQSMVKKPKDEL